MVDEQIGENIASARKGFDKSQKEIAEILKCKQSDISRIEMGLSKGKYVFQYLLLLKKWDLDLNKLFKSDSVKKEI